MKKFIFNFYILFKNFFYLPIYRVDILKYAKYNETFHLGLCHAIEKSAKDVLGYTVEFNLFNKENAKQFGANMHSPFWWFPGNWKRGRMDFLNWLIKQYKDERINLRN